VGGWVSASKAMQGNALLISSVHIISPTRPPASFRILLYIRMESSLFSIAQKHVPSPDTKQLGHGRGVLPFPAYAHGQAKWTREEQSAHSLTTESHPVT
jgi:hypothetical protein